MLDWWSDDESHRSRVQSNSGVITDWDGTIQVGTVRRCEPMSIAPTR